MSALKFPCTIFKTKKSMDDYHASDMRCGDLSETELKRHYHLVDVSTRVDPYTLRKITPFTQPYLRFYGSRAEGQKISREECAKILFDELRDLSRIFSLYGPYRHLIKEMFTHMQYGNGRTFSSMKIAFILLTLMVNIIAKRWSTQERKF